MGLTITDKVYIGAAKPNSGGGSAVIEELNVTPSTSSQTITASGGTDGYSPVNVAAVTSSIDANIVAGNIKNGVSILGVTGDYTGGAPAYYIEKTKDANNKLVNGASTVINLSGITDVGNYALTYAYYGNGNITGALDLSSLTQISGGYACQHTFDNCVNLTSIDLSSLTTISGNYGCSYMFTYCSGITSVDLSKIENIGYYGATQMFYQCIGITGALDLSSLTTVSNYGCQSMFQFCKEITSVDLSSLTNISAQSACYQMFSQCINLANADLSHVCALGSNNQVRQMFQSTSLTSLSFPNLAYTATDYNGAFTNMLSGVTGCTVHFPAEWQTTMSSWTNVTNGFGGTNTTVLFDLPNVTKLDLSKVKSISLPSQFNQFALNNKFSNITSIDLSGLVIISGDSGCAQMFSGCTNITGALDLSSLTTIEASSQPCSSMFSGCTGITSVNLNSLKTIDGKGQSACNSMFDGCTGLTSLSFPALTTVSGSTVFSNMLANTTGVTVHFPSNFGTTVTASDLGGTGTTVLYDLPAA